MSARPTVALFLTCLNDMLYPDTGRATVEVLERLGRRVEFPEQQTCCGQMHMNTGYRPEALAVVEHFVDVFEPYEAVVVPSGSCVAMVKHHHAMLARSLGDEKLAGRAEQLAPRVHELATYITDVVGVDDVGASFPHRVTYHPTCHSARLLGIEDRPVRLLRKVQGLELVDLPNADECCGFGGTFSVKNAAVSTAMCMDKIRHIKDTGAEYVVTVDNACLTNIGGALSRQRAGVKPLHLADILASRRTMRPVSTAGLPRPGAATA